MAKISPPIFYYHSVAPALLETWAFNFLTLKLQIFEDQLIYLKNKNYRSIFLNEWWSIRNGKKSASGREVCLTFDDGFLDNWVYVFPLAKKYKMPFTIFIAPECLDPRDIVRPTLEDVWEGRCQESELEGYGFLSWNEIKIMQESGLVDIQSHTMSHDKYITSAKIKGFYYGGANGVYPTWNARPGIKPFYITNPEFGHYLPFGMPIFEEESAATVRKHYINPIFIEDVINLAKQFNLQNIEQRQDFEEKAMQFYADYIQKENIITKIESDEDYKKRLYYEVIDSKKIIEEKLSKTLQFLCWPHGDNSKEAHNLALEAGYLATTSGKLIETSDNLDRMPRISAAFTHNPWLCRQKFHYKIASHYKKQPHYLIWQVNELKNKALNKN